VRGGTWDNAYSIHLRQLQHSTYVGWKSQSHYSGLLKVQCVRKFCVYRLLHHSVLFGAAKSTVFGSICLFRLLHHSVLFGAAKSTVFGRICLFRLLHYSVLFGAAKSTVFGRICLFRLLHYSVLGSPPVLQCRVTHFRPSASELPFR